MVRGALLDDDRWQSHRSTAGCFAADDDQWIQDDELETNTCRRLSLWLSCCFFIGGTIIGGTVLVLWTVHII